MISHDKSNHLLLIDCYLSIKGLSDDSDYTSDIGGSNKQTSQFEQPAKRERMLPQAPSNAKRERQLPSAPQIKTGNIPITKGFFSKNYLNKQK